MRESRTSLVILGVLDKVILQDPHQDGRQEARQQQHRHTAVDDRRTSESASAHQLDSSTAHRLLLINSDVRPQQSLQSFTELAS